MYSEIFLIVQIQIVTMDLKTASGSIPVTLGTVSKAPIPSTVPREGDEYDAALAQIPRRRSPSFLSIRSMSLLSIFPPSYSQLGSRRSSIASIQTCKCFKNHKLCFDVHIIDFANIFVSQCHHITTTLSTNVQLD